MHGDLFGERAIADFVGVSVQTIRRWHKRYMFPILYFRAAPGRQGQRTRRISSNEQLIILWFDNMAKAGWKLKYEYGKKE